MKLKYLYILVIILLIVITFDQKNTIEHLKIQVGTNYLVNVRSIINTTTDIDEKTLIDLGSNVDLFRFSNSLLYKSESLNRLPNDYFVSVAETLRDIAFEIEKIPLDTASISKDLKRVNLSLTYLNSNIPDDSLDWYNEIQDNDSEVIQKAKEILSTDN